MRNVLRPALAPALIAALAAALGGCSTFSPPAADAAAAVVPALLGPVSAERILAGAPDFQAAYDAEARAEALAVPADAEVLVFFGAWCHDSARQVPRFLRLAEASGLKARYIGLHWDKTDPAGEAARWGIARTPTFVVLRGGREVGRIVERPRAELGAELAGLLAAGGSTAGLRP